MPLKIKLFNDNIKILDFNSSTQLHSALDKAFIGRAPYLERYYDGEIDDVKIHKRNLTEKEIESLYNNEYSDKFLTGLSAHFKLNGDTNDSTYPYNHATGSSNIISSKDRFGETGKAYDFNGNAYINFNFQTSSDNTFSWNFWIKDDSTSNAYRRWLTTTNSGHLSNTVNVREESNGKMALYANGLYFQTSQQNFWNNGNWHMITVVSDGYKTKLYYDSIFLGEVNGSVIPEDGLYAGGYYNDGEYLEGSMDDIRVYKNAISSSDIKQLYDLERVSE